MKINKNYKDDAITKELSELEFLEKQVVSKYNRINHTALYEELTSLENEIDKLKLRESSEEENLKNVSLETEERLKISEELEKACCGLSDNIKEMQNTNYDILFKPSTNDLEKLTDNRKLLLIYKRLLKLKWIHPNSDNLLEGLIFNDTNAYLNHFCYEKSDSSIKKKLWNAINQACSNDWKEIIDNVNLKSL